MHDHVKSIVDQIVEEINYAKLHNDITSIRFDYDAMSYHFKYEIENDLRSLGYNFVSIERAYKNGYLIIDVHDASEEYFPDLQLYEIFDD